MFYKSVLTLSLILLSGAISVGCGDSSDGNLTLKGASSTAGLGVMSPTSFKVKVFAFWVSTSPLCTNPTKIFEDSNPDWREFTSNPTLGRASAEGTYECLIMEMDDVIKFQSETTQGTCAASTEYAIDVCHAGGGSTFALPDGTTGTCSDTEHQRVAVYISTGSTSSDGASSNGFLAPTSSSDATHGFKLNGALTVSGPRTSYFVVDSTNKMDGSGGSCDLLPPNFSFQ